jgi:hypothetical protein
MGALVTYAVYQLKPTSVVTTTNSIHAKQTTHNPTDYSFFRFNAASTTSEIELTKFDLNTEQVSTSHNYALTLNELLLDFFTTEFDQKTSDKWQDKLYEGSPYLSELAGYLKLDKLYGIDLFLSENQILTESIDLPELANRTIETRPDLFKFVHYFGNQYWPMSLLTND